MTQQIFNIGEITPTKYFMAIAVVLAVLFSFIGNQSEQPFLVNCLIWFCQSLIPMYLMIQSHKYALHINAFNQLPPWPSILLSGCMGSALFVPIALLLDVALGQDPWPETPQQLLFSVLDEAAGVMPPVIFCWLSINAPWIYGYQLIRKPNPELLSSGSEPVTITPSAANPVSSIPEALLSLLPPEKRGQLLYMKSELHYLSVVTSAGQSLILFNLKDAIELCGTLDGVQPHRSYWVCCQAVKEFKKQGREGCLCLTDGSQIPVSRQRLADISKRFVC